MSQVEKVPRKVVLAACVVCVFAVVGVTVGYLLGNPLFGGVAGSVLGALCLIPTDTQGFEDMDPRSRGLGGGGGGGLYPCPRSYTTPNGSG